jgi:hypothetical protein
MSSELLINLLQLRDQMKLYHWQTNLHSRHIASDKFLEKYSDVMDNLVEAYQGRYGIIYLKNKNSVKITDIPDDKIVDFLTQMRTYLTDIAPTLFDKNKNGDLFNIRDEILSNIDVTIYLFNQK